VDINTRSSPTTTAQCQSPAKLKDVSPSGVITLISFSEAGLGPGVRSMEQSPNLRTLTSRPGSRSEMVSLAGSSARSAGLWG